MSETPHCPDTPPGDENDVFSFDVHALRPVPYDAESAFLPGEIAALLNRCAARIAEQNEKQASLHAARRKEVAGIVQLVFFLEQALLEVEPKFKEANLGRIHKRLRIVKDQMKEKLSRMGFAWRDPKGEAYTPELAGLTDVDGWKQSDEYEKEIVVDVREPIIFCNDELVLTGAIVVGGPEHET